MVSLRKCVFIKYENGICEERAELCVSTANDLPSAEYLPGRKLYQGSIALDVSTGALYAIDSEGTWYNQDGSGAYTPSNEGTADIDICEEATENVEFV